MTTAEADALVLCVETLKDGYADAFEQFFTLSHPEPEASEEEVSPGPANQGQKQPEGLDLVVVKAQLLEAEESARRGARPWSRVWGGFTCSPPHPRWGLVMICRLTVMCSLTLILVHALRYLRPLPRRLPVLPHSRGRILRDGCL